MGILTLRTMQSIEVHNYRLYSHKFSYT